MHEIKTIEDIMKDIESQVAASKPIRYIITGSGTVEKLPTTQEEWDNYHDNNQFVD